MNLASDAGLASHALSTGYDILFTSGDGTTKIPYERELFTKSTGALVAWVNVSSVSVGTVIYMYYGNASASDQQDATHAVWDGNYKGVWHLKETPPTTMSDGTSGSNNGTCGSSLVPGDQQSAKIDGGLHFGGSTGDDVSIANESNFDFERNNPFTIEYWSKPTSLQTGKVCPVSKLQNSGSFPGYEIGHNISAAAGNNTPGYLRMILVNSATSTKHQIVVSTSSATNLNDGNWHHYVYTYSGSGTAAGVSIYQDGVALSLSSDEDDLASNSILNNTPVHIGSRENAGNWYNGLLDEVRISNNVRGANWITTEYNNQSSPLSFYAIASEEPYCTPPSAYNVTGGGSYCLGGTGVSINLSNSETSVNYELYKDLAASGTILAGTTGSGLTFSNVTSVGSYTVAATRVSGSCTSNMTGSATVSINPLPTATATKTDISCFNTSTGQIVIAGHGGSETYTLFSINNGGSYQGSNTFNNLPKGTYQIRVIDSNTCESISIP